MTPSLSGQSTLARLALFIICLAIAGSTLTNTSLKPHFREYFIKTTPWQPVPTKLKIYEVASTESVTMGDGAGR